MLVQQAKSAFTDTSEAISLAATAEAGNLLVSRLGTDASAGSVPQPSAGWTLIGGDDGTSVSFAMAYRIADGTAADTCTWTWTTSQPGNAWIAEYAGFPNGATVVKSEHFTDESVKTSIDLGPVVCDGRSLVIGAFAVDSYSNWNFASGWSAPFAELDEVNTNSRGGGSVAEATGEDGASLSTTATANGGAGDQVSGMLVAFGGYQRVRFQASYEDGTLAAWQGSSVESGDGVQEVGTTASVTASGVTPLRGSFSARHHLDSGDERAELYDVTAGVRAVEGDELYYGLSYRLEQDPFPAVAANSHQLLAQMAPSPGTGSPPLALYIRGESPGHYTVEGGPGGGISQATYWTGPDIQPGVQETIALRVKVSNDPDIGWVEVYWRGEKQTLDDGSTRIYTKTLQDGDDFNYFKSGYYRDTDYTDPGTVFYDSISLSAEWPYPVLLPSGVWGGLSGGQIDLFYRHSLKPPRITAIREHVPDKLMVRIGPPGGGAPIDRWAEDQVPLYKPNAERVITGLKLMDEIPGGEKEMSGSLARDPRHDWPDLDGFGEVTVMGPGREIVWGPGRMSKAGKERDEALSMSPIAVGNQAQLDDDRGLIGPGYIDSRQSEWGEPSAQRRLDILNNGWSSTDVSTESGGQDQGDASPGVAFSFQRFTAGAVEHGEVWYFGGGVLLGKVRYDKVEPGIGNTDWVSRVDLIDSDIYTGGASTYDLGDDHDAENATDQTTEATRDTRRYASIRSQYGGSFTGENPQTHFWRNLRVLGNHGLAEQGTWPDIGFTTKQMLSHAIPLYTNLELGQIDDDGFVIPQAWSEVGPLSDFVREITRYGLYEWLVFGKTFSLRAPGTYGRTWLARAYESGFSEEGLDTERLWSSIMVRFTDVDGSTRTVGPLGSGAHVEDASLQVTDPDHPAVRADITRRDLLDMQRPATSGLAIAVGQRWLDEANLLSRSGQATLSGYVQDDKSIFHPASHVRGGDTVRFMDLRDNAPRRIVQREYDHDSRSVAVNVDAPSDSVQALLERLQVDLVRLGIQ